MQFESGALGTFIVSDATAAPWSWELNSGENSDYPQTDGNCYFIGGTQGSMTLPGLEFYRYAGKRGWKEPLICEREVVEPADPLARQLEHFLAVVRRESGPICPPADAAKTIAVMDKIRAACRFGLTQQN